MWTAGYVQWITILPAMLPRQARQGRFMALLKSSAMRRLFVLIVALLTVVGCKGGTAAGLTIFAEPGFVDCDVVVDGRVVGQLRRSDSEGGSYLSVSVEPGDHILEVKRNAGIAYSERFVIPPKESEHYVYVRTQKKGSG